MILITTMMMIISLINKILIFRHRCIDVTWSFCGLAGIRQALPSICGCTSLLSSCSSLCCAWPHGVCHCCFMLGVICAFVDACGYCGGVVGRGGGVHRKKKHESNNGLETKKRGLGTYVGCRKQRDGSWEQIHRAGNKDVCFARGSFRPDRFAQFVSPGLFRPDRSAQIVSPAGHFAHVPFPRSVSPGPLRPDRLARTISPGPFRPPLFQRRPKP